MQKNLYHAGSSHCTIFFSFIIFSHVLRTTKLSLHFLKMLRLKNVSFKKEIIILNDCTTYMSFLYFVYFFNTVLYILVISLSLFFRFAISIFKYFKQIYQCIFFFFFFYEFSLTASMQSKSIMLSSI